jgi:hypothetical protein
MECLPPLRAVDQTVACSLWSTGVFSASPSGCVANRQIVVRPSSHATFAAQQTPIRIVPSAKRFEVSHFANFAIGDQMFSSLLWFGCRAWLRRLVFGFDPRLDHQSATGTFPDLRLPPVSITPLCSLFIVSVVQ